MCVKCLTVNRQALFLICTYRCRLVSFCLWAALLSCACCQIAMYHVCSFFAAVSPFPDLPVREASNTLRSFVYEKNSSGPPLGEFWLSLSCSTNYHTKKMAHLWLDDCQFYAFFFLFLFRATQLCWTVVAGIPRWRRSSWLVQMMGKFERKYFKLWDEMKILVAEILLQTKVIMYVWVSETETFNQTHIHQLNIFFGFNVFFMQHFLRSLNIFFFCVCLK